MPRGVGVRLDSPPEFWLPNFPKCPTFRITLRNPFLADQPQNFSRGIFGANKKFEGKRAPKKRNFLVRKLACFLKKLPAEQKVFDKMVLVVFSESLQNQIDRSKKSSITFSKCFEKPPSPLEKFLTTPLCDLVIIDTCLHFILAWLVEVVACHYGPVLLVIMWSVIIDTCLHFVVAFLSGVVAYHYAPFLLVIMLSVIIDVCLHFVVA